RRPVCVGLSAWTLDAWHVAGCRISLSLPGLWMHGLALAAGFLFAGESNAGPGRCQEPPHGRAAVHLPFDHLLPRHSLPRLFISVLSLLLHTTASRSDNLNFVDPIFLLVTHDVSII
ncbi:unnamed protein product, partial [Ectocarpus sp. 12 AP-2014]